MRWKDGLAIIVLSFYINMHYLKITTVFKWRRISLQDGSPRLFREKQLFPNIVTKFGVRKPCALGAVNNDSISCLVNIVVHAKICSHTMHQHTLVWGHLWKLVVVASVSGIKDEFSSDSYQLPPGTNGFPKSSLPILLPFHVPAPQTCFQTSLSHIPPDKSFIMSNLT